MTSRRRAVLPWCCLGRGDRPLHGRPPRPTRRSRGGGTHIGRTHGGDGQRPRRRGRGHGASPPRPPPTVCLLGAELVAEALGCSLRVRGVARSRSQAQRVLRGTTCPCVVAVLAAGASPSTPSAGPTLATRPAAQAKGDAASRAGHAEPAPRVRAPACLQVGDLSRICPWPGLEALKPLEALKDRRGGAARSWAARTSCCWYVCARRRHAAKPPPAPPAPALPIWGALDVTGPMHGSRRGLLLRPVARRRGFISTISSPRGWVWVGGRSRSRGWVWFSAGVGRESRGLHPPCSVLAQFLQS